MYTAATPIPHKLCNRVALTYVSRSPYRVPVARLAAKSAIEEKRAAAKAKKK